MINYFKKQIATIENSLESIDLEVFKKLIDSCETTLRNGNKIIVSGLGKNVPVCDKFVGTVNSLGMRASFMHTNSAAHGDIGMVENDDLVIILTKSGETTESVYLADLLKKRGNKQIWLFSYKKDSTLSRGLANRLILNLIEEGDPWNIVPNNSTTINLIVLQALAMQLAERMGVTLQDFKRNHPGGFIGETLRNV